MDFRQLRYFVAVAEELSFSAAARRLHMSQPPLSMQVKAMEEELGAALFDRNRHKVALTEAGRMFLDEARATLAHLDRACDVVRLAANGDAGEIRVAFTGSVPMVDAFPRLVQSFRETCPGARVALAHMSTGQQLQALADGQIDVGILRPAQQFVAAADIEARTIWEDRLALVLPADHALAARRAPPTVAALSGEPFILFPRGLGCGLYDHVMAMCNRAGYVPRLVQEAREVATIIGLVAAGTGISILPESCAKAGIPGIVWRRLATPESKSRLLIAHRPAGASPLVRRFIAMAARAAGTVRAEKAAA
ncbi:MAG: LysR family transcriptional regulator [Proteobacteria bacterium]|nr:LysR family transcriptional regulator [Pseudomonadota bacterium]